MKFLKQLWPFKYVEFSENEGLVTFMTYRSWFGFKFRIKKWETIFPPIHSYCRCVINGETKGEWNE